MGVVTQPPRPAGRKRKLAPSAVHAAAEELGIPVLHPEKAGDPEFLSRLLEEGGDGLGPLDLAITAAYGNYLPKKFLALPVRGTLNVHPSLLPRWRGASPVQRSLEAGDDTLGVSVLFTVQKMDAGPVVAQVSVPDDGAAGAGETLGSLFALGTDALLGALPDVLSGKITMENAAPQDEGEITQAAMISKREGVLRPHRQSASDMHCRVRAFDMWPGCTLELSVGGGDPVSIKVGRTRTVGSHDGVLDALDLNGQAVVLPNMKKRGLMLMCGDGSVLELLDVQPPTKKMMDAKSFVNGLKGAEVRWIETPEEAEEEQ